MSGEGMSGLPKPEVDHVGACPPCLDLQVVDDREHVRRQVRDAPELHASDATGCRCGTLGWVPAMWDDRRMSKSPAEGCIFIVIEIPRGSRNKYEIDHESGRVFLDRRLFTATTYPADYGFVPDTLGGDGDPLDALVLLEDPVYPGVWVEARPRRCAVHARRSRRGRQADLRSVEGAALAGRPRHRRPDTATARRDPALLRGLQGARARQVHARPSGWVAARRPGARSTTPAPATASDRVGSPYAGAGTGLVADSTGSRRSLRRYSSSWWSSAAPTAPARSFQWANATRGCVRRSGG